MLKKILYSFIILLMGCQQLKEKSDQLFPTKEDNKVENQVVEEKPKKSQEYKLGIILGPGGVKSFAHIGVLTNLEKSGLKIHNIVGIEWGALVGAIYSLNGKSHETSWQMFKLGNDIVPSKGFISSKRDALQAKQFQVYLKKMFTNHRINNAQVNFSCPIYLLGKERIQWISSGTYTSMLDKCIVSPPMYKANRGRYAAMFALEEAVAKLKDGGATHILFVDLISKGNLLHKNAKWNNTTEQYLWEMLVRKHREIATKVDYYLAIDTRGYGIMDFDSRRNLKVLGDQQSREILDKIKDDFGY